ncbi:MAG: LacI family transcriptional regulator [Alicyclobacillus sp.]|nr:LacI family transcriptional regulator [Alicyclobacillus sp.]
MASRSGKTNKVNISTIAKLAETSTMTVSRVLNNRPDVAKETRERILAIIQEQGYRPHALARKLSGGKTRIIGLALYSKGIPVRGLYVEVLQGLQAGLAENDYDLLLLAPTKSDSYDERIFQTTVLDGLVLMGNWTSEDDILHLRDAGFPFITIGRRSSGNYTAPFVAPDYQRTFVEILDFAATNGARRIAVVVAGSDDEAQRNMPPVQERLAGIEIAKDMHLLPDDAISIIPSTSDFSDGYQLFMKLDTLPDAVVLDSTEFSFGVVMALRDRKVRIHQEVQLLGVDFQDFVIRRCEDILGIKIPQWTVPWFDIGKRAAEHIVQFSNLGGVANVHEYVNFERKNLYIL